MDATPKFGAAATVTIDPTAHMGMFGSRAKFSGA
jgi:hypothetical protein